MRARTLVQVTYNTPNKMVGQTTSVVIGKINMVGIYPDAMVGFTYENEDGTIIYRDTRKIDNATADEILGANPIDSMSKAEQVFYGTLKSEMASTFGIELDEIVIEA